MCANMKKGVGGGAFVSQREPAEADTHASFSIISGTLLRCLCALPRSLSPRMHYDVPGEVMGIIESL